MDNFIRFKTLLAAGQSLPPDLVGWLLEAIGRFESGDCKTLCVALGLRARGLSSMATRHKLEKRNHLIRTIAQQYPGKPWQQAVAMAEDIKRYPRIEHKALYAVLFSMEVKIPQTAEQLYNLLK